jgi:manganese transport protein
MNAFTEKPARGISMLSAFRRFFAFVGPGFLVAVGYMDPGNWATDLAGGSEFGYALLWVILLSNLMAILFQHLCIRLYAATGEDLAQNCRGQYSPLVSKFLWISAQIGIIAMDLAELLGSAIALQLLFGIPLFFGALITAFDVLLLLAFTRMGFRWLESFVALLVFTIAACIGVELLLARPDFAQVVQGFIPTSAVIQQPGMLFIALGIVGATVMPHNLYLHSSIVGTRNFGKTETERKRSIRYATYDSTIALSFAFFVNAGLLILSATAFHKVGHPVVDDIREAHRLLDGALGSNVAAHLFAIALLASGVNATITGTMAGQIVLEGFLRIRSSAWFVRTCTRFVSLIPALLVIGIVGEGGVVSLLLWSQVILSLQLGFACWPLVRFTGNPKLMGPYLSPGWIRYGGYTFAFLVIFSSIWFIFATLKYS